MNSDINYIIQESINGDKKCQEILLIKLNPLVYKNIYKYWNPSDAITEDLVQEGYTVILQALKTFDKKWNVHFLQYAKTKIQYFYRNFYKKSKNQEDKINLLKKIEQENFELEKNSENFNTLGNVITRENSKELLTNIKQLSAKEQKIIYLYYYKEESLSEVSKKLNIPYRTVIGKKKTALKKLRTMFQEVR